MRVQSLITVAAATLLLGACGSDDATGPGDGNQAAATFQAAVGAPLARNFSGAAAFGVDNGDPEVGFALGMVEPGQAGDDMVLFHRADAGQLGGTTVIGDGTDEALPGNQLVGTVILDANTADPMLCLSRSGTLKATNASASRLKGTFVMQVDCVRLVSELEYDDVTVSGSFDAAGGSVTIPD